MSEDRRNYFQTICHSLAKATGAAVRLFYDNECLYYYSIYHLHPDPVTPFLPQLLDSSHCAGVITTPLYQFYGYLTSDSNWRIVIGPSCIDNEDPRILEEQLFLLGIPMEQKADYTHILRCFPSISAERMGWLIVFLSTVANKEPFSVDQLYVNVKPENTHFALQSDMISESESSGLDLSSNQDLTERGYQYEKLMLSYIAQGEAERLRDFFSATPCYSVGTLSADSLRQLKDLGICGAAISSRAAISGGLDWHTAYMMSDLYIQKIEMLRDISSLETLRNEMMVDFANAVSRVRFHIQENTAGESSSLFAACANYVSQNLYNPIRAEEIAAELGYTRSYLCSCFKRQTGLTLTQYVLQEKVFEAQRMLQFTDKNLSELAALFSFSSQSHFQNVFKRITGETPQAYRNRIR